MTKGELKDVFSTCVEVFLGSGRCSCICICFLHVCGGVSKQNYFSCRGEPFSPRVWRCFLYNQFLFALAGVFSTCVEVFPLPTRFLMLSICFLHVCGGVSTTIPSELISEKFSPRVWRCFPEETMEGEE